MARMNQKPYRAPQRMGPSLKPWQVALAFTVSIAPLGLLRNWYMDGLPNPGRALAVFAVFGLVLSLPFVVKAWLDGRRPTQS